ncbi:unnamed protein product, partial [Musa hybrid cultivar]
LPIRSPQWRFRSVGKLRVSFGTSLRLFSAAVAHLLSLPRGRLPHQPIRPSPPPPGQRAWI